MLILAIQERANTRFAPTTARKPVSDVGANNYSPRHFPKIRIVEQIVLYLNFISTSDKIE
jgi:hypothetical protein